jgi:hypothetical protein
VGLLPHHRNDCNNGWNENESPDRRKVLVLLLGRWDLQALRALEVAGVAEQKRSAENAHADQKQQRHLMEWASHASSPSLSIE